MHALRTRGPLAYALGSGSAKGFAHIGALKVFEEAHIKPDIIAGSSIGAVVGALSAAGYSAQDLHKLVRELDLKELFSLSDLKPSGAFVGGHGVQRYLRTLLPETFDELKTPFCCVSSDLRTGKRVLHTSGDLVHAIRASISIPAIFSPVEDEDRLLIDGGVTEPVPVAAAREVGAEHVVAVTLYGSCSNMPDAPKGNGALLERLLSRATQLQLAMASLDLMQAHIAEESLGQADVVVRPDVNEFSQLSWADSERLVTAGEDAAKRELESIINLAK